MEQLEFAGNIPSDLVKEDARSLFLTVAQRLALAEAQEAVEADLRFELMAAEHDPYRRALWRFACLCVVHPDEDQVDAFLADHAKKIESRICYLPVEALTVTKPLSFQGIRLLPTDDPELPPVERWFTLDPPIGSVLAVPVEGTNLKLMHERARHRAIHALRIARIAVRGNHFLDDQQLRFRLAETYSFGEHLIGFNMHPDALIGLTLDGELLDLLESEPIARLDFEGTGRLGRRAERSARWLEEATLATDAVSGMLFGFFALESMLGRRDQKLKGYDLAFERAMLSVAVNGHFGDPGRAYRLYAEVRSEAVHGGDPELSPEEVRAFLWDIRLALGEYLELAERQGLGSRGRVLAALRDHPDRPKLRQWLREHGDPGWEDYLDPDDSP